MLLSKGTLRTAGSRLITYGRSFWPCRCAFIRCMKVVLPEPGEVLEELDFTVERQTSHAYADNSYRLATCGSLRSRHTLISWEET